MGINDIVMIDIPAPASALGEHLTPEEDLELIARRYYRQLCTPEMRFWFEHEVHKWAARHARTPAPLVFWHGPTCSSVFIGQMGFATFRDIVGSEPVQDDLHRVNCRESGTVGHLMCGWCNDHGAPRFRCGCLARQW